MDLYDEMIEAIEAAEAAGDYTLADDIADAMDRIDAEVFG